MTREPRLPSYRRLNAFTLIELLVVISIIALLIAILLPALSAARDVAQSAKCLSTQRQIGLAMFFYANDYNDHLPPARLNSADGYTDNPSFYDAGASGGYAWAALLGYKGYMPVHISASDSEIANRSRPGWEVFACNAAPNLDVDSSAPRGIPGFKAQHISFGYNFREIGGSHHLVDEVSHITDTNKWYISSKQIDIVNPGNKLLTVDSVSVVGSSGLEPTDQRRGYSLVAPSSAYSGSGRPHARHGGAANILWGDGHATSVRSPKPDDHNAIYAVLGIGGTGSSATDRNVWSRSGRGGTVE